MAFERILKVSDGQLRGRLEQTSKGFSYLSFQGIPYAEPPVGPLRFQPPKEIKPWSGIRDALIEGHPAPGFDIFRRVYPEVCKEDCLYLNVYAPEDLSVKRPVLFWIHGGAFNGGDGSREFYGPDYLVSKGIVVVTINYRLGVLGFLSLQNATCPGNNGLKDQVCALRWVQKNIGVFGGDANSVTIFGESAGGASVQYLMLSPLSKGLFHAAITQSGSVLNPWAVARKPVEMAFKLGELLGCETDDRDVLFEFLKTVEPRELIELTLHAKCMKDVEPNVEHLGFPFVPVVEPDLPGALISSSPQELLKKGQVHDVPYILGVNTLEGLIILKKGEPIKPLNTIPELETLIPIHLDVKRGSEESAKICQKIQQFYFPNGFDEKTYANALSSIYFLIGNDEFIRGLLNISNRKSKTYFYEFVYDGSLGAIMRGFLGFSDWKGTIHAEELLYMWRNGLMPVDADISEADEKAVDRITDLWFNFAKNKQPTANDSIWKPITANDPVYLEIGDDLRLKRDHQEKEMAFWRDIALQSSKL